MQPKAYNNVQKVISPTLVKYLISVRADFQHRKYHMNSKCER